MTETPFNIREITTADDFKIAQAIRNVLLEFNVPKVGTAYADSTLDIMTATYNAPQRKYFVVTKGDVILGGAGIAPLANYKPQVCELQKMYFLPEARGVGLGFKIMEICLEFAERAGFKQCYLETMPYMLGAQKLYKSVGFQYLEAPLGNTGHFSCPVWMLKTL